MRRSTVLAALVAVMAAGTPSWGANSTGGNEIVVAVIDTGIHPTHQEFVYTSPTNTTDQFVGWWDFTTHDPGAGQAWDTLNPTPFDDNGHGTATASLAVGRNIAGPAQKDPSFAPGAKLAVARVCGAAGCTGDIAGAIRWATDTVKADVITISIGHIVPFLPDILFDVHEAAVYARSKGVLVVFSNGNGTGNLGLVPGAGWATGYGDSTAALAVGATGLNGFLVSSDPEVVAKYSSARVASRSCNTCYTTMSGTSFSAPLVAGMGARAMEIAVNTGPPANPSPAYIETLLKYAAFDNLTIPPSHEGYGTLSAATFGTITTHAAAGTLPARPSPDVSGLYVENVSGTLRTVWTDILS